MVEGVSLFGSRAVLHSTNISNHGQFPSSLPKLPSTRFCSLFVVCLLNWSLQ